MVGSTNDVVIRHFSVGDRVIKISEPNIYVTGKIIEKRPKEGDVATSIKVKLDKIDWLSEGHYYYLERSYAGRFQRAGHWRLRDE